MYSAIIFDMDGLMFDTEPIWEQAWISVLEARGLSMRPELFSSVLGVGRSQQPDIVRRIYGPREDAEQIVDEHYELAYKLLEGEVPVKPGLFELLYWLGERDIPCAVASSSPRRMIDHHLAQHGLSGRFFCVVDGGQVKRSKPAPDMFLRAAAELEVSPQDALVLEDSANGIYAGCAGGFDCIMVPDMQAPTPELESLVTYVCHDLLEVRDILAGL